MTQDAISCIPVRRALRDVSSGTVFETGAVIARIFDLLEGTRLEPLAAEVACGLINGIRARPGR